MIEVDTVKKETTDIFISIKKIIDISPKDKIAFRPPSLAIIGPPGSGKDKIGKHFANTYGLVIISKLSVLWAESQKDTSLSVAAKTAIEKGEWLDDEVMAKLVIQRLSEPDCEFNG